MTFNAANKRR